MTGNTSTIGLKTTYASGKRDNNKVSIIDIYIKFLIKNVRFDNTNSTIKSFKFLIYINVLFYNFLYIIPIISFQG